MVISPEPSSSYFLKRDPISSSVIWVFRR